MHTDTRFCKVCLKERPARPLNWPSTKGKLVGCVCKACTSALAKAKYTAEMSPETLARYLARQEHRKDALCSDDPTENARLHKAAQRTTPDGRAAANEYSREYKAKLRSTPEGKAKDKLYERNRKTKRLEAESNGEFKNESDILA